MQLLGVVMNTSKPVAARTKMSPVPRRESLRGTRVIEGEKRAPPVRFAVLDRFLYSVVVAAAAAGIGGSR